MNTLVIEEIHVIDNSTYVPKVSSDIRVLSRFSRKNLQAKGNLVEGGEIVRNAFPQTKDNTLEGFCPIPARYCRRAKIFQRHIRQEVQHSGHMAIASSPN